MPVPPQKVKRRKYYQTGGPDYIWAMDQNEKVGMFGFKILCAVDGFSRYPIHWEVRLAPLLLSPSPPFTLLRDRHPPRLRFHQVVTNLNG